MRPGNLRFLTDENVSPRLVIFLRERGHNVLDVKEEGWHGKDDAFLLHKAAKTRRLSLAMIGTLASWQSTSTSIATE